MQDHVLHGKQRDAAVAAHEALIELMSERRGRGLDLPALLEFRHLSRVCAFRCGTVQCAERTIELEQRAGELHAATATGAGEQIALLERCIARLLGQAEAWLARPASAPFSPLLRA